MSVPGGVPWDLRRLMPGARNAGRARRPRIETPASSGRLSCLATGRDQSGIPVLVATAAIAALVSPTMGRLTAFATDLRHVLAILADGFAPFPGDHPLFFFVHACKTAIAVVVATTGVRHLLLLFSGARCADVRSSR